MQNLTILVDYDNIEPKHRPQGPVNMGLMILNQLPANLLHPYDTVSFRLYGGWRTATGLTNFAQDLIPKIRAASPTVWNVDYLGESKAIKVFTKLADAPLGSTKVFEETLVRNRPLRHFRTGANAWVSCADKQSCGLSILKSCHNATPCQTPNCYVQLGDILVRDEQKMVDTMMVADIAYERFVAKANEVVVICSDADIWPGIYLALQSECRITHLHTKPNWRTPNSLLQTLSQPQLQRYRELSLREPK